MKLRVVREGKVVIPAIEERVAPDGRMYRWVAGLIASKGFRDVDRASISGSIVRPGRRAGYLVVDGRGAVHELRHGQAAYVGGDLWAHVRGSRLLLVSGRDQVLLQDLDKAGY